VFPISAAASRAVGTVETAKGHIRAPRKLDRGAISFRAQTR
jgi:hypothetical protein